MLIDTMTGIRGLKEFVSTLTDLPVQVALTHGHMDHAGGVFEFGRCAIHPADIPMLDGRTLPARMGYVRGQLQAQGETDLPDEAAFVPDSPVEFSALQAGDRLDLGGRALEVLLCRDTPRVPCATWIRTREISLPGTPATTIPW